MNVRDFQKKIESIYFARDASRGWAGTFAWFAEEVGELARARRKGTREELAAEFADCLAWLATLASLEGVDLEEEAVRKYGNGCPRCGGTPCTCAGG
ncbi:MAG: MazG nucleotide pyrophosphohydrolase domain-containing protein [Planctomycetota bacterium]